MNEDWLVIESEFEGLPILLRVRRDGLNNPEIPHLGIVNHRFERVLDNGLPQADYNDSLLAFDYAVLTCLEEASAGIVYIVETFSGKRNYYACVKTEAAFRQSMGSLLQEFPDHDCSIRFRDNMGWLFYRDYQDMFDW